MPTARSREPNRPSLLAGALLAGVWIALHAPVLRWLGARFVGSPLHAGIVLVAAALLLRGVRPGEALAALGRPPRAAPVPVAIVLGTAVALVACEHRLGTTTLSAILAGIGAYGLSGLYLDAGRFRRALPGALLLTVLLPFGEQADTYLGFFGRAMSARAAAALLAAVGKPAVPVETLLVLENGIAHVDVPCSGARSLWTGLLFFLAATCVLGRRPGIRWMLAGLVHLGLLLAENVVRVAAVVLIAVGVDRPRVAEILHAPLGVLGFALACAATLAILRRFVPAPAEGPLAHLARAPKTGPLAHLARAPETGPLAHLARAPETGPLADARGSMILAAALLGLALARPPRAAHAEVPPVRLDLGPGVASEPLPVTAAEADLFRRWGGSADKRRFRAGAVEGSLLAVFSRSFRAHHPPEICLAGSGVRIEGLRAVSLGGDDTVRVAAADWGRRTVIYWFQSPARTTGDLAARIWDEARGSERRWAQISIIADAPVDVASPEGRALVDTVRAAAARVLAEESP